MRLPGPPDRKAQGAVGSYTAHRPLIERRGLAQSQNIEWSPIGALLPNPRNPRTHSRKQIKRIAASIQKFGFLSPILVDDNDMVLAGHGRLEAAKLENFTHVPILRFNHLTAAQKRAYLIADNRIAEQAGWDRDTLALNSVNWSIFYLLRD